MANARRPTSARATFITKAWRVKLAMRNVAPRSFAATIRNNATVVASTLPGTPVPAMTRGILAKVVIAV